MAKDILYHYTSHNAFTSIISNKSLWSHDYRLSNDGREIQYALDISTVALEQIKSHEGFSEYIEPIKEFFEDPFNPFALRSIDGYICISSFSEEGNLLSQWRAYAPKNGYSIGFDSNALKYIAKANAFKFGMVEYDFGKSVELIVAILKIYILECQRNDVKDANELIKMMEAHLLTIIPLIKHESFSEEKEWRLFRYFSTGELMKFNNGINSIRPYYPIALSKNNRIIECLKHIVIGPSDMQGALRDWTSDMLINEGYKITNNYRNSDEDILIMSISGTPYRSSIR
jgi:hypothetical protein